MWCAVAVLGLNCTAGSGHAECQRKTMELQRATLCSIRQSINRACRFPSSWRERWVKRKKSYLSKRFVTYSGEEVPKMQVLSVLAVGKALPPTSHGGAIDAQGLVSEGTTRLFLDRPEESLIDMVPKDAKLQAKVHISPGEGLDFCKLLVERNVWRWVADDEVLVVNGQQVFKGMFAAGKGSFLENGAEVQRTIMNLIPSNSVLKQAEGGTSDLPAICQYPSLLVQNDERIIFLSERHVRCIEFAQTSSFLGQNA